MPVVARQISKFFRGGRVEILAVWRGWSELWTGAERSGKLASTEPSTQELNGEDPTRAWLPPSWRWASGGRTRRASRGVPVNPGQPALHHVARSESSRSRQRDFR